MPIHAIRDAYLARIEDALEVWQEWALELAELDALDDAERAIKQLKKHLQDSAVESDPHSPPATVHPPLPAKEDPAPSKATAEITP